MADSLTSKGQHIFRGKHCGTVLERIIFPFVGLNRALDSEGLPKAMEKSRLEVKMSGRVGGHKGGSDKGIIVIVELVLAAKALSIKSGEELITAGITAHGHFRCDEEISLAEAQHYVEENTELVTRHWTQQIYTPAVMELDRLVQASGLPSLKIPLNAPEFTDKVADKPAKKAAKRVRPPKSEK